MCFVLNELLAGDKPNAVFSVIWRTQSHLCFPQVQRVYLLSFDCIMQKTSCVIHCLVVLQWSWCSLVQIMGNIYKPVHFSYSGGELFFVHYQLRKWCLWIKLLVSCNELCLLIIMEIELCMMQRSYGNWLVVNEVVNSFITTLLMWHLVCELIMFLEPMLLGMFIWYWFPKVLIWIFFSFKTTWPVIFYFSLQDLHIPISLCME